MRKYIPIICVFTSGAITSCKSAQKEPEKSTVQPEKPKFWFA